jgi:hypothetical protein
MLMFVRSDLQSEWMEYKDLQSARKQDYKSLYSIPQDYKSCGTGDGTKPPPAPSPSIPFGTSSTRGRKRSRTFLNSFGVRRIYRADLYLELRFTCPELSYI